MNDNIPEQIERLKHMKVNELRQRFKELFGREASSRNRIYLIRKIAWQIQAKIFGGLSERAKERARELADFSDIRTTLPIMRDRATESPERTVTTKFRTERDPRLPLPGTVLSRPYKGEIILVTVLTEGFDWKGKAYRSLSAVARAATGSNWNGFEFFGLVRKGVEHGR